MQKWDFLSEYQRPPYMLIGKQTYIEAFGTEEGYVPIISVPFLREEKAIVVSIKTEDGQIIYPR